MQFPEGLEDSPLKESKQAQEIFNLLTKMFFQ
jgi:hypothetical protein